MKVTDLAKALKPFFLQTAQQVVGAVKLWIGRREGPRVGMLEYETDAGEPSYTLEAVGQDNVPVFSAGAPDSGDPDDAWCNIGRVGYPRIHFETLPGWDRKVPIVDHELISAGLAGTLNHGELDGLAGDDHLQYHTDERGDARYAALGHGHAEYSLTDGTRPFTGPVAGVDPLDPNHLATRGYVDEALATDIYVPTSRTLSVGTETGTYANAADHFGLAYELTEVNSGNGIDVTLHYSGIVGLPTHLWVRAYYHGSASHEVKVYLFDYQMMNWEEYATLLDADSYTFLALPIVGAVEEHIASGEAAVRFAHAGGAVPGHKLFIDYCVLVKSGMGAVSHDAVTLAADADAVLGLTGQEITLDTQPANTVFAGATSGGNATPTFRGLVAADLPEHTHAGGLLWQPLTNGLADSPELVFADGDVIMVGVAA